MQKNELPACCYAWSLLSNDLDKLKHVVYDKIEDFYKSYDPVRSIDLTFVTDLISEVHSLLDKFMEKKK